MMNARAAHLFGGGARELLNQPLAQFVVFDDQGVLADGANGDGGSHAAELQAAARSVLTLHCLDGRTFRVDCTTQSVPMGKHGEGKVLVFNDGVEFDDQCTAIEPPSDRAQRLMDGRMRELTVAKEAVERANHVQLQFLAKISHELRTPMHAIMGFASLAIEKWGQVSSEKLLRYVSLIRESGERLVRLVNALLDFSKLQAGHMRLQFQQTDFRRLVEQVSEQTESLWREKVLSIHWIESPPNAPITCDVDRMTQVLWNLISNAIKFSPHGGRIYLSIVHDTVPAGRREADHARLPAIRFVIRDEGAGIPPAQRANIFDPFVQVPGKGQRVEGTGLGLAICREIVLAHGGTIWADNHGTGGAVFSILLPQYVPAWVRDRTSSTPMESDGE